MKKVTFYIILSLATVVSHVSCGDSPSHESKEQKSISPDDQQKQENDLWVANSETHQGMNEMKTILAQHNSTIAENRNYAKVIGELEIQCDYIIQNCSMKGEAHEQLHTLLHPILSSIKEAKSADSYEKMDEQLSITQSMISKYFEMFEVKAAV